jgi:hypothetical protein
MNRGRRRVCDAVWTRLTGAARARRGPVLAAGSGREREKRGSAVAGHRHAGPASTVPGGAV